MNQDTGRLVPAPIFRTVACMLLDGGIPNGLNFAPGYPSGYPSGFSLEVMEAVVAAQWRGSTSKTVIQWNRSAMRRSLPSNRKLADGAGHRLAQGLDLLEGDAS